MGLLVYEEESACYRVDGSEQPESLHPGNAAAAGHSGQSRLIYNEFRLNIAGISLGEKAQRATRRRGRGGIHQPVAALPGEHAGGDLQGGTRLPVGWNEPETGGLDMGIAVVAYRERAHLLAGGQHRAHRAHDKCARLRRSTRQQAEKKEGAACTARALVFRLSDVR
jgi:hypothetical protein